MTIHRIDSFAWKREARQGIMLGNLWASPPPRLRSGVFRMTIRRIVIFPEKLERAKRFELSTPTLARLCSTPELRPLGVAATLG
jgi:hypothetical protein